MWQDESFVGCPNCGFTRWHALVCILLEHVSLSIDVSLLMWHCLLALYNGCASPDQVTLTLKFLDAPRSKYPR
jgi:hypothetical protein